jgi:hypothetical protein
MKPKAETIRRFPGDTRAGLSLPAETSAEALRPPGSAGPRPDGAWGRDSRCGSRRASSLSRSFRPELVEGRPRGARDATNSINFLYGSPSAPRARWSALAARPGSGTLTGSRPSPAASGGVRSLRGSSGRRLRVPRAAPGPGHAFPGAAPVPPHVTTPHERAPRVDGTAPGEHETGTVSRIIF